MKKIILILIVLAIFKTQAMAHMDRIIQVDNNGNMDGLPENYQPAKFDLKNMAITLATTTFNMPPCVSKYFKDHKSYKLQVTSSWYHTNSNLPQSTYLPPYIVFNIIPKDKSGYSLLFGLDDLKPIEFRVIPYPKNKRASKIEIGDHCKKDINNSYVTK